MPPSLPIYLPDKPEETFAFIQSNIQEEFAMNVVTQDSKLELNGIEVRFLRTDHPVPTHAMRFAYEGKVFVYTSDTALFDDLISFCTGADLLLAEATLQDSDRELESTGHMTARTAGTLASRANAGNLMLTHFWPEYERQLSLSQAREAFSGPVQLARQGLELHF